MVLILASIIIRYHIWFCIVTILLSKHWGSHSALDYLVKNWICILWGPEDDSIESKHVAHGSMVVDIPINCCVRLLHLYYMYTTLTSPAVSMEQPPSYVVGKGGTSRVKQQGEAAHRLPPPARLKWVELYLHSTYTHSWLVHTHLYPLP